MSAARFPRLILPAQLEGSLLRGHPWVYRTQVPKGFGARSGQWVSISSGKFEGFALWDETSPIALRVYSYRAPPDRAWFRQAVGAAWERRAGIRSADTDCFRLLNGEGDGMPGVVADVYGRYVVLVTYCDSARSLLGDIAKAVSEVSRFKGILHRESKGPALEAVYGELPPESFTVRENGLKQLVHIHKSQKTGLFLDHRENRAWLATRASGRSVLNLFSYTGAFGLYALKGGATGLTQVDSAKPACEAARQNLKLNGFDAAEYPVIEQDVYQYLSESRETFDIVVSDPPSLARDKTQRNSALRAYAKLHALALGRVKAGGLLCAASCTAQVSEEAFTETLLDAALKSKVDLQVVRRSGQAEDHPWRLGHPEGRYLKFLALRVEARS